MDKSGSVVRSRRRRVTFALFGRSTRRGGVQPFPDRVLPTEDLMSDVLAGDDISTSRDGDTARPHLDDDPELQETIARVQQDARADRRFSGRLPAEELDQLIEAAVRSLWATSNVKTFLPLIALRHASEQLEQGAAAVNAGGRPGGYDA